MGSVDNNRGLTLVEMVTVVAILGVLVIALAFSFQGWLAKYKVEDETKRFYADLSDARARAMQKKKITFVESFSIAFSLESSLLENRFFEAFSGDSAGFQKIKQYLTEETKRHKNKIQEAWEKNR